MEKLVVEIVNWLRKLQVESNTDGFVLGISGGVDSAVLFMLLLKGDFKFLALYIENGQQISPSENAGLQFLKKNYTNNIMCLNAQEVLTSFIEVLHDGGLEHSDIEIVTTNINARIRENIFYSYAKIHNFLVLGSINKIEYNIGYFVKNSSIGDLLPIADLDKTTIRKLARHFGLPKEIVIAKASGCNGKIFAEDEWGISEYEIEDLVNKTDSTSLSKNSYYIYKKGSEHKRAFPQIFKVDDK